MTPPLTRDEMAATLHGKNSPIAVNFGSIADMRLLGEMLTRAAEASHASVQDKGDV